MQFLPRNGILTAQELHLLFCVNTTTLDFITLKE